MEAIMKISEHVVGFIDIGTNSVRLLVVRINPNLSYITISREKEVVRLGQYEFEDGFLKPEAMNRTFLVCRKFAELARTYGASKIIAVGTCAIREAKNQSEFLQKLLIETGLNVQVISGRQEACLIYLGVSNWVDIGQENAILIDVGGGSTEIAIGNQYKCFYMDSLRLGAIRLTTQFIGEGWTKKVPRKVYEDIKMEVSRKLLRTMPHIETLAPKIAYGSSGTVINLAEITNRMFKKQENGTSNPVLSLKNLSKMTLILCSLPLAERKKIPGINPDRADIIIAGAALIETIMEEFGLEEISITQRDLNDGLLVNYLSTFEGFQELQKTPVRNRSVLQLVRFCNNDEKHSETVAALALQLFDSGKITGLHNFGDKERELLKYAAILHDVGDFLSFNNHQLHSYYIITNADLLGFDKEEIEIIANIAKFHRKKIPSKKALKTTKLNERSKKIIIVLSVFLRFAEKLDRSHRGLVKKVEFRNIAKDRMRLTLFSDTNCSMEEWSTVQNEPAFHAAFGKKLDVKCEELLKSLENLSEQDSKIS